MSHLDVKFADMPQGVRQRWLDWANSHDWGRRAYYRDGFIHACENWESQERDGTPVAAMTGCESFDTPRKMRDWAGY